MLEASKIVLFVKGSQGTVRVKVGLERQAVDLGGHMVDLAGQS